MASGGELVDELRSYVGLTPEDQILLARFLPIARPYFSAIADEFYAVIRVHGGAFAVLEDEAQARRLHASLQVWLGELLSGPYDAAYAERHARVGQAHVRVGLGIRYMVTAMSRVRASLQRVAARAHAADEGAARTLSCAVGKVTDLDLGIMLESYQEHFVDRLERARAKEAELVRAQLDERRRFFSDALDAADVIVLGFDDAGRVVVANRKAEEITGYAAPDLVARDVFGRLFGDRAEAVRERWLTRRDRAPAAEPLRTRSGEVKTVRWQAAAHRAADAGGASVVVVGVDLTSERELELRARQNERLAATGALAAGLAHEIRNPLNGASLHLAVLDRALARSPEVPAQAREATDVLRAEIKRLGALVSDFLEVARPKPLTRVECDVNEIATAVRTLLAPEADSRGVVLSVEPSGGRAMATLDPDRVRQVLLNLVRNGMEAVGEGGQVGVRVRVLPSAVEVDVADDGSGIPNPAAPIFDAFYTTKERGTGLGLSIVHRIVADHGGDVRFESRPGRTVFTVRLPTGGPAASPAAGV